MGAVKNRNLFGRHVLADFFGVDPQKLRDRETLMRILVHSLKKCGFRIIREAGSHKFMSGGKGVTGFVLLAQSHAAFHSYPEFGYIALDIYSCGRQDPRTVVKEMEKHLGPKEKDVFLRKRG